MWCGYWLCMCSREIDLLWEGLFLVVWGASVMSMCVWSGSHGGGCGSGDWVEIGRLWRFKNRAVVSWMSGVLFLLYMEGHVVMREDDDGKLYVWALMEYLRKEWRMTRRAGGHPVSTCTALGLVFLPTLHIALRPLLYVADSLLSDVVEASSRAGDEYVR